MSEPLPEPFPDRLRLPLDFDADRLSADMAAIAGGGWISHFVRQNYEGDWSVIPLRAQAGVRHPVQAIYSNPSATAFEDLPALEAAPYLRTVLDAFACPLQAVRLMRLAPGSLIKEHRDHDLSFEDGAVRIHIPVTTNDAVDFRLNGTSCAMAAGTCWYLRLSDPHSVANRGPTDRVHLVIDAGVNPWVRALFERAVRPTGGRAGSKTLVSGP